MDDGGGIEQSEPSVERLVDLSAYENKVYAALAGFQDILFMEQMEREELGYVYYSTQGLEEIGLEA